MSNEDFAILTNLENIEKKYNEQCKKVESLQSDLVDLQHEQELNLSRLRQQDTTIADLQAKCNLFKSEIESVQERHKAGLQAIQTAQESLLTLKKIENEQKSKNQSIKDQILAAQLELTKLSEKKSIVVPKPPDKSELDQLNKELQDAIQRTSKIKSIIAKMGEEINIQFQEAQKESSQDLESIMKQIHEHEMRHTEYQTALINLQNSKQSRLSEMNEEIQKIKLSNSQNEQTLFEQEIKDNIKNLQEKINTMSSESKHLEEEIERRQKEAEKLRITFQTGCEQLEKLKSDYKERISKNETRIKTQKKENSKLMEILASLTSRIAQIDQEITAEENGIASKPDFEKQYNEKVAEIKEKYNKYQTKYKEKMKLFNQKQKQLEESIGKKKSSIETIIAQIQQMRDSTQKVRNAIHQIKKKTKETKKEIEEKRQIRDKLEEQIEDAELSVSNITPLVIPNNNININNNNNNNNNNNILDLPENLSPIIPKRNQFESNVSNNNIKIPQKEKRQKLSPKSKKSSLLAQSPIMKMSPKDKIVINQLTTELNDLTTEIGEKQQELQQLIEIIQSNENEINQLKIQNEKMEKELNQSEGEIEPMKAMYQALLKNQDKIKTTLPKKNE